MLLKPHIVTVLPSRHRLGGRRPKLLKARLPFWCSQWHPLEQQQRFNGWTRQVPSQRRTIHPLVAPANVNETTDVFIDLTKGVPSEIKIVVSDSAPGDNTDQATNFLQTTYTVMVNYDSASSSMTAGDGVRLTLMATLSGNEGDVITIKAPSFGVPSSIDADDVTINNSNPSDVTVTGTTIELVIPDMDGPGAGNTNDDLGTDVATTIRITSRAGVTNPSMAGLYGISVNDDPDSTNTSADEAVDALNVVKVIRTISLDPKRVQARRT